MKIIFNKTQKKNEIHQRDTPKRKAESVYERSMKKKMLKCSDELASKPAIEFISDVESEVIDLQFNKAADEVNYSYIIDKVIQS